MGSLRGIHLQTFNSLLAERYGESCLEAVKPFLSQGDRKALYESEITATSWVDLGLVLRNIIAVDKVFGRGDLTFAKSLLSDMATRHWRGAYRILLSLSSPESILKKTGQLLGKFYDSGQLNLAQLEEKHAVLKLTNFPEIPHKHECLLVPYLESLLELTGARMVECVHTQCLARGADACIFEIRWK